MSFMIEVVYRAPRDLSEEAAITAAAARQFGQLTYVEEADNDASTAVTLTYEFETYDLALLAAEQIRTSDRRVNGPYDYGEG